MLALPRTVLPDDFCLSFDSSLPGMVGMRRGLLAGLCFLSFVGGLASEARAGVTSLLLRGEPGDFIVGEQTLFFTAAEGSFVAYRNPANVVSVRFNTPTFDHFWTLDFVAPHFAPLAVGSYEGATRYPFQDEDQPGLSVGGDGRGCNTSTGRFEIKEIVYGAGDAITAFWAAFEQHCEYAAAAAFGEVRFNADVTVVVTAPPRSTIVRGDTVTFDVTATDAGGRPVALTASDLPAGATFTDHGDNTGTFAWTSGPDQIGGYTITFRGENDQGRTAQAATRIVVNGLTSLALQGEPGSVIGDRQLFYTPADGTFTAHRNFANGVSVSFMAPPGAESWYVDFTAPNDEPLTVGAYESAGPFPFHDPMQPGLGLSGIIFGCITTTTARFDVKEIAYGSDESIIAFWAVFELHCGDAAAFGEIRFNADSVDLTIVKAGSGQGTVSTTGPTIACDDDCVAAYRRGEQVVLAATAGQNSVFLGWTGGGCSGVAPCTVTLSGDTTITATFDDIPFFGVSVVKAGAGAGRVRSDVPGIDCGASCAARYIVDAVVVLTATPDPGFVFAGWSGPCSGTGTCTLQLTGPRLVTATFIRMADLTVTGLSAPGSVRTGQTLAITSTVKNAGSLGVGTFTITFYLSATDGTPGAGVVVGARSVGGLGAGASSTATTSVTIALGFQPGTYFLSALVDHAGIVPEIDEGNNGRTAAGTVSVVLHRPDLTVTALSAPATGRTGQSLLVSNTVKNVGQTAAAAFRITFYMSATDSTPGAGVAVGFRLVGGLGVNASTSAATSVIVPASFEPGAYFVSAIVDRLDAIPEVDGANNGLTAAVTVTIVLHRPDLTMTVVTAPASGRTGRPLAVANTVRNVGQAPAPAFRITFYMSATDSTPGAGVAVGVRLVDGLAAGGSSATTTSIVVPIGFQPGTYFVSAVAKHGGAFFEADSANNGLTAAATVTIAMHRADLVVTALGAPATARTGQPLAVGNTVKNVGQASAGAFRVTFYMSATDSTPGAGTVVGLRTVAGLAPGASAPARTFVTVPVTLEPGTYFLSAVADKKGAIVEVDDTNNGLTAVATVTVVMHRPDLVVTALGAPATARTGQPLVVSNTVKNVGTAYAGAFRITFYMSATDNTPGAGVAVGLRLLDGLAPNTSAPATTTITIPLGFDPGTYFLSAIVDRLDAVVEVDNANNGLTAAATVTVVMYRPDLTMTALGTPATGHLGRPLALTNTVRNVGESAAPGFRITFYMSATDSTPGAGAVIGFRTLTALGVGAGSAVTTVMTIPLGLAPGSYFVSSVADNLAAVAEEDEANNGLTAMITVTPYQSDLTITSLVGPPSGVGVTARALAVAATVKNTGSAPAGAFRVRFYLSSDATLDAADILLGAQAVDGLAVNGTLTTSVRPVIPAATPPGVYFLIAIADEAGTVAELLENNNVRATVGAVAVVPLMVATYPVILTLSTSGCTDPSLDGTSTGPVTLSIPTQNSSAFSGSLAFSETVDGIVVVTTFTLVGTVNTASQLSGSFTVRKVDAALVRLSGDGLFSGTIAGKSLSASLTGAIRIFTGDSCRLTALVTSTP